VSSRQGARRRAFAPAVESVESRFLLNAAGAGHLGAEAAHHTHVAHVRNARVDPLTRYRVFIGTVTKGPDAGTTFEGPMVVGFSGRIQFIGEFISRSGAVDQVFGTQTGGSVAFSILLPGGPRLEAAGSGSLNGVPFGFPGGDTLVGYGNLSGPAGNDTGFWETLAPSRLAAGGAAKP
jgi:hypothetical protein